jgi:outer membrane scaffolding protein for murein synthesis (MipA/OmpV family)
MIKYAAFALSLASVSVFATSTVGSMNKVPDISNNSKKGFHGQIGLGVASMPEYIGAEDLGSVGLPLINVNYNDTFYFKFNRLGAWFYKHDSGFRVGGLLTRQAGYDKSDLPEHLKFVGGRDDTTLVGINAQYKKGMFSAESGFLVGTGDNDKGSEGGKFYIQARYTFLATPKYTLTGVVKLENWNEDLVQYYYGGKGASTNVTVGFAGTYRFAKKWALLGAVTATSLGDEITGSSIVEDDSSNTVLVGVSYLF